MTENTDRRIAFLDIDGTIIAHGGVVAPSTIAAVRDARAAGHLVFICSGRASGDVHPDVAAIGFDGEITNGGVYATVGDETVVSRPMPREAAEHLISVLEAHDTGYVFQSNDHIFADEHILAKVSEFLTITAAERKTEQRQLGLDDDKPMPLPKYRPMSEVDLGDVAKATFISPDAAALGLLQAELGDAFHVIEGSIPLPGGSNGEISMTGVTKGSAIELVLAHLGIDKAAAVGIGDSWNDLEMFDVCGTSFAMGEAPDGVKARAQFVTTGVLDDGVANAFRQLGMIG